MRNINLNYINTQLTVKLLNKNLKNKINKVNLNINFFKLDGLLNINLLEGFFLLEYFSDNKPFIRSYKKNYKEINIQIMNNLIKKHIFYFLNILKIFYLPILYRRNIIITEKTITENMFQYSISDVNFLTFMPDIFFKWKNCINFLFCFENTEFFEKKLYLEYLGFVFTNVDTDYVNKKKNKKNK